jgi:hypothetical protein
MGFFFKKINDIVTPWEIVVLIGITWITFDIPLEAAFQHKPTNLEISLDLILSGVFLRHALIHPTGPSIKKHVILNPIFRWLPTLPLLSLAVVMTGNHENSWPIYLQVVRLIPLVGIIQAMIERTKTRLVPKRFKLIVASSIAFLSLNALACGWLVIYPPGNDPLTDYNKALYWLITTIATVGYGDITPSTNGGRVYAMGIMILGATIWGVMIASASRLMLASDRRKERKKEKMEALHSLFRHYEIPKQTQEQVVGFFNHLWSRKMSDDEHAVLSELPPKLQSELQTFMNLRPISRVSLFKGVSVNCLAAASKKLEQTFFAPGDKIICRGDIGAEMYLIGHGSVTIHNDEQYIATLGEGTCFGELALIGDGLRTTDVTAATYCDVFKLSKEKFTELFNDHMDLRQNIERLVNERHATSQTTKSIQSTKIAS